MGARILRRNTATACSMGSSTGHICISVHCTRNPAVPRQRKFQADLAVINECLNELIETVGGVEWLPGASKQIWSAGRPGTCWHAWLGSGELGPLCAAAGWVSYCSSIAARFGTMLHHSFPCGCPTTGPGDAGGPGTCVFECQTARHSVLLFCRPRRRGRRRTWRRCRPATTPRWVGTRALLFTAGFCAVAASAWEDPLLHHLMVGCWALCR